VPDDRPAGECPRCAQRLVLDDQGRLPDHARHYRRGVGHCYGSGRYPKSSTSKEK
jgi:hypothetical protein